MSKEEFFKTLTKEQQNTIEFLIDTAYCNGYNQGVIDGKVAEEYNSKLW